MGGNTMTLLAEVATPTVLLGQILFQNLTVLAQMHMNTTTMTILTYLPSPMTNMQKHFFPKPCVILEEDFLVGMIIAMMSIVTTMKTLISSAMGARLRPCLML